MSWHEDDFYNEPSEFDMQVEEFKESLAKAVKSEFLEEMERLKKENRNLREIKENFEQIKRDYERKKMECDWERTRKKRRRLWERTDLPYSGRSHFPICGGRFSMESYCVPPVPWGNSEQYLLSQGI